MFSVYNNNNHKNKTNLQEHLAHRCRNLSNFSCFAKLLLDPSILVKWVVAISIFFFFSHEERSILPNTSLTQEITVKYSNLDFCFPLWFLAHWAPCLLLDSVTSDIYHCRDKLCQEHLGFRQKTKIDALQKWSKWRSGFDYCLSPQPLKNKNPAIWNNHLNPLRSMKAR